MEILRGAAVDGRTENIRYRQNQLHQLHASFRKQAAQICSAISTDTICSQTSAEAEFYLSMDSIKQAYDTLDFDSSLKEEYNVKYGKDNPSRRVGHGVVVLRPGQHSRFYSIVTPLAMAIAAGNCIFLELENSSYKVDELLKQIIPKSLDRDIIAITTSRLTESTVAEADVFLDQTNPFSEQSVEQSQVSRQRTIAVVDRSADIRSAARDVVRSRLSPNDASPYAPDLVIVNDFNCDEFIRACLEFADAGTGASSGERSNRKVAAFVEVLVKAERAGEVKVTKSANTTLSVVEVTDSDSSVLATMKVVGPFVVLRRSTGVVDTISSQRSLPESIAAYIYANPQSAKMLADQLPAAVSYINQIPNQLLIGPIATPHSLHPRYSLETFSTPRPQFTTSVPSLPTSSKDLRDSAIKPLKPTGQKPGYAIGYFEQGILLGLSVTAFIILPLVSWGAWTVGKRGLALLR